MAISLLFAQLALCLAILRKELWVNKCRRIATTAFFGFYLVVFVIEPLVIHLFYGGPRSIVRGSGIIFADDYVFFVYNMMGMALLLSGWMLSMTASRAIAVPSPKDAIAQTLIDLKNPLGALVPIGFWMFFQSTGLSMAELLVASRFAWFESASYNPLLAVASAYLISLTPLYFLLFLQSRNRNATDYLIMFLAIAALIMYGVVTKDRKWIFYLLSGWLASAYLKGGRSVRIGAKAAIFLSIVAVIILLSQILRDILPTLLTQQADGAGDSFSNSMSRLFVESDLAYFYSASIEAIHQNLNNGFSIPLGLIRRLFLFFVPTSISFGVKVEDISAMFSDIVSGGDDIRRGNMPPGFFGLFILSFGFIPSVLLMPAVALAVRWLDTVLLRPVTLVTMNLLSFLLVGIVFLFRGDESTVIYFPIFGLLVSAMWAVIARIRRSLV